MPAKAKSFKVLLLALCGFVILMSSCNVDDTSSVSHRTPSVGTTLSTYSAHLNAVGALAWSPDGSLVASASYDKTVQVWDPVTGHRLVTYR